MKQNIIKSTKLRTFQQSSFFKTLNKTKQISEIENLFKIVNEIQRGLIRRVSSVETLMDFEKKASSSILAKSIE